MPSDPSDLLASPSCDCGTFFLDVVGNFSADQLRLVWSPQQRQINAEVEQIIESTWAAEADCARRCGKQLYNGRMCRLLGHACRSQDLELTLGEVSFKEFLGTNLTHAYLRYLYGPEVLADAVGVSAAVRTGDGFMLLGRRSQRVFYHAGRLHPIGTVMAPGGAGQPPVHPFSTMTRELLEEANLSASHISGMVCLGLVRDKHIVQPELIFDVSTPLDVPTVRRLAAAAPEAAEHSELLPIRDHPAAVVTFIEQNYGDLTPVALAALLLHGLHRWGSGWFATTRGYLRSVI